MKVVIFCGGQGTRMREETEFKPKPLVEIGGYPILWHIMKLYSHHGINDFVLALGYKGDLIKEYFVNYCWRKSDFSLNIKNKQFIYHEHEDIEDWDITFAETGLNTLTAKRLFLLKKYLVDEENFLLTYGDGVSDVDITEVIKFHKMHDKIITVTGVNPISQYGLFDIGSDHVTRGFKEKPVQEDFINGGFMVVNRRIFDYLTDDNEMFEFGILPFLAGKGEVAIYKHFGFWHSMDTYRDYLKLNKIWADGTQPWKIWK